MRLLPEDWGGTLRSITAPVILFGLVFLVLGAVAIAVIVRGPLMETEVLIILLGIGIIFLLAFIGVFILVFGRPENLMMTGEQHLQRRQAELDATQTIRRPRRDVSAPRRPPRTPTRSEE